ncbi:MAG: polyphosphate kinase 1 [Chromatiales bacterium]|nr:polyphosphate kinase 1 [Chromatiales bacterium]
MNDIDLTSPDLYLSRELSLLEFNRRVLELAQDQAIPLLERLFFLCISNGNMDEFFEIRVSGLKQKVAADMAPSGADQMPHAVLLKEISERAHDLVTSQYQLLNDVLFPALADEGIRFLRRADWSDAQAAWVQEYFRRELLPVLTPIGLDPAHPFPRLLNKSLNFVVTLEGKDAFGRDSGVAVVQAPRSLPRLIRFPDNLAAGPNDFIFLSAMIHAHVDELFPGMRITGCYQFRVTRNSDLFVDEEEVEDLRRALEGELLSRNYGQAVRLEVADNCPPKTQQFLLKQFELGDQDLYQVNGPVNLNRLMAVRDLVERPDLKYPSFTPEIPRRLARTTNLFELLKREDVLLHHPFQSFTPVVEFILQAAKDQDVLAIKQTLYRTGSQSAIVDALVNAARSGKEVTVVIELRARFDEAANINLSNRLQQAGCQVVYGVVGYKTHAKMSLVVRREKTHLVRYAHLGTGNYHAGTARVYTDYGLLTGNPRITEDVHKLFQQLTGLGRATQLNKLLQSPFTLIQGLVDLIEREIANAEAGKPAHIMAKMNSLLEPSVIRVLYRASQAGVRIDLIVRGICALRPGIPGVSENIRVRSVMGRLLEHSRVFYFHNDGAPQVFLSSADWMPRNLLHRVEVSFPIEDADMRARVIRETFDNYLADNTQAWELQSDGSYQRLSPGDEPPYSAQQALLEGQLPETLAHAAA